MRPQSFSLSSLPLTLSAANCSTGEYTIIVYRAPTPRPTPSPTVIVAQKAVPHAKHGIVTRDFLIGVIVAGVVAFGIFVAAVKQRCCKRCVCTCQKARRTSIHGPGMCVTTSRPSHQCTDESQRAAFKLMTTSLPTCCYSMDNLPSGVKRIVRIHPQSPHSQAPPGAKSATLVAVRSQTSHQQQQQWQDGGATGSASASGAGSLSDSDIEAQDLMQSPNAPPAAYLHPTFHKADAGSPRPVPLAISTSKGSVPWSAVVSRHKACFTL